MYARMHVRDIDWPYCAVSFSELTLADYGVAAQRGAIAIVRALSSNLSDVYGFFCRKTVEHGTETLNIYGNSMMPIRASGRSRYGAKKVSAPWTLPTIVRAE